jgi:hypothetical protein
MGLGMQMSETRTTPIITAPIDFVDFPAILMAVLLGVFLVARKRGRKTTR